MPTVEVGECGTATELGHLIGPHRQARLRRSAALIDESLGGGTLWHVNSTPAGGGVAEMLHTLIPLYRDLGVRARWAVIPGDDGFFRITKRLGAGLYGDPGDDGGLGPQELRHYRAGLASAAEELRPLLTPADVVVLHDHQTAGLVDLLRPHVRAVHWRGHVGVDEPNVWSDRAWDFLAPCLQEADGLLFSVGQHAPARAMAPPVTVLPPFVSPSVPKNCDLADDDIAAALALCGLGPAAATSPHVVATPHGPVTLSRQASVVADRPPEPGQPLLVQVSRWDRLKDMHGVLEAFDAGGSDGYLALVGPDPVAIPDDTEAVDWYRRALTSWRGLPAATRRRAALICLPMDDLDENAVMVNAIQRAADVVLQKSLAEGFGLTVTEAMWKAKPVLATAVGGIRSQIDHEWNGLLAAPGDLAGFGALMASATTSASATDELGPRARDRVQANFLPDREVWTTARLLTMNGDDDGWT